MDYACVRCTQPGPLNAGLCKKCESADREETMRWAASIKEISAKIKAMPRLAPKP